MRPRPMVQVARKKSGQADAADFQRRSSAAASKAQTANQASRPIPAPQWRKKRSRNRRPAQEYSPPIFAKPGEPAIFPHPTRRRDGLAAVNGPSRRPFPHAHCNEMVCHRMEPGIHHFAVHRKNKYIVKVTHNQFLDFPCGLCS